MPRHGNRDEVRGLILQYPELLTAVQHLHALRTGDRFTVMLRRSFAAILSVWFLLVLVEPQAVHSCPVHDGSAHGSHAAQPAQDHASHASHSGGQDSSAPVEATHCSCPGDCAASSLGYAIVSAASAVEIDAASWNEPALRPAVARVASRAPVLLPVATGPPVLPA